MKRFLLGYNLELSDLEKIIIYVNRYFNFLNTMYQVEEQPNGRYSIYWNMTPRQYAELNKKGELVNELMK